jgi:hypothetical protein
MISIFELLSIYFHLKSQYHKSPTVTRLIIDPSQTPDQKGIPLKPIIVLIPNVDFKIVQLIIVNKFLIKHKIYNGTHTIHRDFYPGNPN